MFHVVLFEPEIPPNTGNIIRLCANTGAHLHLIEPLGFEFDDRRLKRAGLDYHEFAEVRLHRSLPAFVEEVEPGRLFGFSTHARRSAFEVAFQENDAFLFGPETRGLPEALRQRLGKDLLRLPMRPGNRSLNLSNSVAVVVYEAWRQSGFAGAEGGG
ncbi:MAG TPA: tRNA (uridine(34)/cytosine(34)/5-carboxymethylaminomethyluridine(34)-2'-O)-methyltransferase TrmL, partial [Aliiroseovarius sp.]|nr:tRNA (uridine(34)/cytosine(34)/5-carboxymethylaminomethyluridine(34)-2'-O)-methyltransferase TrmL [Aliiroseovarius sp.]